MTSRALPILLAATAGLGTYLLYTALWCGHRCIVPTALTRRTHTALTSANAFLLHSGIAPENRRAAFTLIFALFLLGFLTGWTVFGGVLAPLGVATFAASFPFTWYRQRIVNRRNHAAESWPRMIEELRVLCGAVGRPIPHALWDVGRRGPEEYRDAFANAEREWLLTTDFAHSIAVLKHELRDPTADVTCETLLVAHEVGGNDVDRRLEALADDRLQELMGRKDARAKQAGVRFARRFVLIVPCGMAVAGISIGNGRAAYASSQGQLGIMFALILLAACWIWSGRLIAIPGETRVFSD